MSEISRRSFLFLHQHSRRSIRSASRISGIHRSQSSSAAVDVPTTNDLPTRHSWKQPPKICHDLAELEEMTASLLDQSVGSLYAATSTTSSMTLDSSLESQRSHIYDVADPTIQQVEYLIRGHASKIEGSIYYNKENGKSETDASQQLNHVRSMKQLLQRMQEEGNMYMRLRHEALALQEEDKGGDYSSSDSDSDSDSSSSSSDDEDGDEEDEMDFAPPGATITMYDSVLDALAVSHTSTNVDPLDIFHTSMHALSANDLDKEYNFYSNNEKQKHLMHQQRNKYTLATPTTYNATLRGLLSKTDFNDPKQRDNALDGAFGVYNHLTHSEHLLRNTASILYLLRIVDEALPSSRVKGNISVTLWKQACQFGVITPELSQAIQNIHQDDACGPEFDVFIKQVATPIDELPQRYRRFANKTKHLKNY